MGWAKLQRRAFTVHAPTVKGQIKLHYSSLKSQISVRFLHQKSMSVGEEGSFKWDFDSTGTPIGPERVYFDKTTNGNRGGLLSRHVE